MASTGVAQAIRSGTAGRAGSPGQRSQRRRCRGGNRTGGHHAHQSTAPIDNQEAQGYGPGPLAYTALQRSRATTVAPTQLLATQRATDVSEGLLDLDTDTPVWRYHLAAMAIPHAVMVLVSATEAAAPRATGTWAALPSTTIGTANVTQSRLRGAPPNGQGNSYSHAYSYSHHHHTTL